MVRFVPVVRVGEDKEDSVGEDKEDSVGEASADVVNGHNTSIRT